MAYLDITCIGLFIAFLFWIAFGDCHGPIWLAFMWISIFVNVGHLGWHFIVDGSLFGPLR